jgi:hypothetical protein
MAKPFSFVSETIKKPDLTKNNLQQIHSLTASSDQQEIVRYVNSLWILILGSVPVKPEIHRDRLRFL